MQVSGDRAFASGEDQAGDRHFIVIEDNGDPGKGKDEFGLAGSSPERTLALLLGIQCGAIGIGTDPIDGGNYQVQDAS